MTNYVGCIYLPTQGTHVDHVQECYEKLSLDISRFQSKGRIILLGDFNAHVGEGLDFNNIVGVYGKEVCDSDCSKLIELMQQLDLVMWNCREFCIEPQRTRIMQKLDQHSIVDYVASDRDLLKCFGSLHMDSVDIGTSDYLFYRLSKVKKGKLKVAKGKELYTIGE